MSIKELLGKEVLFFDGGMGTMLQAAGLEGGEIPEHWCFEHPDVVMDIHYQYLKAGANIVETNTFGLNPVKFDQSKYSCDATMQKAISLAKDAIAKYSLESSGKEGRLFVAASIGPCGSLLEPLGEISFDEAYNGFKTLMVSAEKSGADIILIETIIDTYELKAAILAAKENTNLPIIASFMLDEKGQLLTGADIKTIIPLLEGLRVDAIGINCGFGPEQMSEFVPELTSLTNLPLMINSNAGMPAIDSAGNTYWNSTAEEFGKIASTFIDKGVSLIGGCCGTTPEHISYLVKYSDGKKLIPRNNPKKTIVSSYSKWVEINDEFKIIGEKINPTGNKTLKEAIKNENDDFIAQLALSQVEAGAHIIDINAGIPGGDEVSLLSNFMRIVQGVCPTPVMIDSSNEEALEKACRYYNGKPFINSVSGKQSSLDAVLPICAKYGGVLIALALDDNGIPKTAEERLQVALNIVEEAKKYGIGKENIVVDPLTLTISSDSNSANITLKTIELLKEQGIKSSIGLSNISFGLPQRSQINATFFAQCLTKGLNTAIVNPNSIELMDTYYSHLALSGQDENCTKYIERFQNSTRKCIENACPSSNNDILFPVKESPTDIIDLKSSIEKGLKDESLKSATMLLKTLKPLEIVNNYIVTALDKVGKDFELGKSYLPQLLMSAEAAQSAFSVLQQAIATDPQGSTLKPKFVIATVKGDIHDIGKNIAKVLLENYGYQVIDLGKDVEPQLIVDTVKKEGASLVGLSALMTTTLPSMEETINLLRKEEIPCKVFVGGAVLTEAYANTIGADYYCKDAMSTVKFAENLESSK